MRNLGWFEVGEMRGAIKDGKVQRYQVTLKIDSRWSSSPVIELEAAATKGHDTPRHRIPPPTGLGNTNRPRIGRKQEQQIRVRLAAGDGILRVAREEGVGTGTV